MALIPSEQLSDYPQDSNRELDGVITPPGEPDLLGRIRSLKTSRNERFPPRTPCPSIDFSPTSHSIGDHLPLLDQNKKQFGKDISRIPSTLAHPRGKRGDMAAQVDQSGTERHDDLSESNPQGSGTQASRKIRARSRTNPRGSDLRRRPVERGFGIEVKSIGAGSVKSTRLKFANGSPRYVLRTVEPSTSQLSTRDLTFEYQPTHSHLADDASTAEGKIIHPSQAPSKISGRFSDAVSGFSTSPRAEPLDKPLPEVNGLYQKHGDPNAVRRGRQPNDLENTSSTKEGPQHISTPPSPPHLRGKLSQSTLPSQRSVPGRTSLSTSPAGAQRPPLPANPLPAVGNAQAKSATPKRTSPNQSSRKGAAIVDHSAASVSIAQIQHAGPSDGLCGQPAQESAKPPSPNNSGAANAQRPRTMANVLSDVAKLSPRASPGLQDESESLVKGSGAKLDSKRHSTSTSYSAKSGGLSARASDEKQHGTVHKLLMKRSLPHFKHESHLTVKPFRRRKYDRVGSHTSSPPPRHASQTPLKDGDDTSKGRRLVTDATNESFHQTHAVNAASFDNIIVELETLLQEAISIARNAADKEEDVPPVLTVEKPTGAQASIVGHGHGGPYQRNASERLSDLHSERTEHSPGTSESGLISSYRDEERNARIEDAGSGSLRSEPSYVASPAPTSSGSVVKTPQIPMTLNTSKLAYGMPKPLELKLTSANDGDLARNSAKRLSKVQQKKANSFPMPAKPAQIQQSTKEQSVRLVRDSWRNHHLVFRNYTLPNPVIQPRTSSRRLKAGKHDQDGFELDTMSFSQDQLRRAARDSNRYCALDSLGDRSDSTQDSQRPARRVSEPSHPDGPGHLLHQDTITSFRGPTSNINSANPGQPGEPEASSVEYTLRNRHHFSLQGHEGFSFSRLHRRAPIARDWSKSRKRFVAAIACLSTGLVGLIVGVYAGEVPAIQYAIIDEQHISIMGNVVFFIGIAVPSVLFWPLPLLHGRKPYTVAALSLLLPLQFPQAIAVGNPLSPFIRQYRIGLLLARALAGVVMGFANMNFLTTLLDLFGSSLQSGNPHQEVVNDNDVRRHGGGMGVWLGIWTWCFIGSIGVGFLAGAAIINTISVTWGFWFTIIATAVVLVLNILTPEVRRSPYRRSMTEVQRGTEVSTRVARGEVMMHLYSTGPRYWWEEVLAGHVLCLRMLAQPGFFVMTVYLGWIYGQVVMVIVLLGALTSKYYRFQSQWVGLCVAAIPLGALLAVPFQKASLLSRARHHPPRTDSMTFEKRVTWTSHLVRRGLFMIPLPFAGLAYTLSSGGAPTPVALPVIFAALIGFLSTLAFAECNGLIMETFDTSDLQPGMTGRPRRVLPDDMRSKRTNYSCFPRVTAAFAITQSCAFLIAAAATGTGGVIERAIGAQQATAVVAGILLLLTLALIGVLTRFRTVQIIPTNRVGTAVLSGPEDEWKPVVIGNPSGTTRRISILELGAMTRWTEIRKRNRLVSLDEE